VLLVGLLLSVSAGADPVGRRTPADPSRASQDGLPAPPPPPAATGAPRLRQVDGGPGYYSRFEPALPSAASFFPIGVWYESVLSEHDVQADRGSGINVYVQLTDTTDLALVRDAGSYAIDEDVARAGSETVGWFLTDEADMWAAPGDGPWTGNHPGEGDICGTTDWCGYTVLRTIRAGFPQDARLTYANYGKGVVMWDDDDLAARFVNEFQDLVSADLYWFTDEDLCSADQGGYFLRGEKTALTAQECHLAANYGRTVDRVRSLQQPAGSKPVWALVEVGHPFTESSWPSITGAQVQAAVWSSLIHGARGIVYFNHSFGGPCQTQHALRDPCYREVRAAVTAVDRRIARLAPVLNAPWADDVTTAAGAVDTMTRYSGGHLYVFAGSTRAAAQRASFTVSCVDSATVRVLDENRTLTVTDGHFSDGFADGNAVHIYRIDDAGDCRLG
jgi:hypothetical protein